jgi:hypothetical protein
MTCSCGHSPQEDLMSSNWTKLLIAGVGAIALCAVTSGSARAADYSGRAGRDACRAVGTCTVYDFRGMHQEPCWPTKTAMAYPGDPGWPFEPGVCDTVQQMNAAWPEGADTAHSVSTTSVVTSSSAPRQVGSTSAAQ